MKLLHFLALLFLCKQCSGQIICDILGINKTADISLGCAEQLNIMCNNESLLWRMIDASSKFPISGMSYSSNNDLGNFDECIDINYEGFEGNVKGKYCGLSVAVVVPFLESIPDPYKLNVKPRNLAGVSEISHKEYLALKDSTPNPLITTLSICIPDKCTSTEIGKYFLIGQFELFNVTIFNFIESLPCMTKDSNTTFYGGDIACITVLALIFFAIVWCTTYDFLLRKMDKKPSHPLLLSFSFLTNGQKLIHTSDLKLPDQIGCLNGLRFISMMWVIAGHGYTALMSIPVINYAEIRDIMDRVPVQYITAGPIAVDTFFFLSGFLLTFGYLKVNVKLPTMTQVKRIPIMIIHRYLRLTPAVAMLYFVSVTIFRMTGNGPMWGIVASELKRQCVDHWWGFFLYIQNYVNYKDMCLNHTWYLSADMQMFVLAPLVLIPITVLISKKKANQAIIFLLALIVISLIISIAIRFGDQSYDSDYDTHSRFSDYLIGVLLGVIMRDPRFVKFPFSKLTNLAIWCFALNCDLWFIFYYHNIIRIYNHTSNSLFYVLYRPIWCFSLAWMVYSCHKGYGGVVNWFLSLPAFQIGARLSYCMYLVHAVVEMYYVGLVRTWYYWGYYMEFYLWCGHFVVTMILSVVWSLSFESPMMAIEKFIFGGGGRKPKKQEE